MPYLKVGFFEEAVAQEKSRFGIKEHLGVIEIKKNKLIVHMHGSKLQGKYCFIHFGP